MPPELNNILNTVKFIADIFGDVKSLFESMKWFLLWLSPFMKSALGFLLPPLGTPTRACPAVLP